MSLLLLLSKKSGGGPPPPQPGLNWVEYALPSSSTWGCCFIRGDVVLAVNDSNTLAYSEDRGKTWASVTNNVSLSKRKMIYNDGKFITVLAGGAGPNNRIAHTTDYKSTSWTLINPGSATSSDHWRDILYDGTKYVANAYLPWSGNKNFYTSTDLTTWTAFDSPQASTQWQCLAYAPDKGIYVSVSANGAKRAASSTNGSSWTIRDASNNSNEWLDCTYAQPLGRFVAVAVTGTNRIMYSDNGTSWTGVSGYDTFGEFRSVCYGAGLFITTTSSGYIFSSPDGITWTQRHYSASANIYDCAFDVNYFCAIQRSGSKVFISEN